MAGGVLIWKEGEKPVPVVDAQGVLEKYELRPGHSPSLAAMLPEWTFFSPAILYLYGGMSDTPLIDFAQETGCCFHFMRFSRPIFRGLELPDGDNDWNYALWAVPTNQWTKFLDFMCSVNLTDTSQVMLGKVGFRWITIMDPVAVSRLITCPQTLPTVPIGVFGIDANTGRAMLLEGPSVLMDLPTLRFYPPTKEMLEYAAVLFAQRV